MPENEEALGICLILLFLVILASTCFLLPVTQGFLKWGWRINLEGVAWVLGMYGLSLLGIFGLGKRLFSKGDS